MGQCASSAPLRGVPKCHQCGKEGGAEWQKLPWHERQQWVWDDGDVCTCKPCKAKERIEEIKYQKERAYYSRAKGQLYPKQLLKQRLRRVPSDEPWENTQSFYQPWRPASSVAQLVQAALGKRKGSGFVGPSAAGEAGRGGAGGGPSDGPSSNASVQDSSSASRRHLELLDEELQEVDEEDLGGSSGSASVRSSRADDEVDDVDGISGEARRQQQRRGDNHGAEVPSHRLATNDKKPGPSSPP